ncbi:MAG: hypothetical protein ACLFPL_00105 [Candidatus Nanoarchaeia archaeon]
MEFNKNYREYNKSQMSIFIIIGVLIIVTGIIYFIFSQTNLFQSPQAQSQEQISEILRFCVGESLDSSVRTLQFKGGRINSEPLETQKSVDALGFDVYSWSRIIPIEEMEAELSQVVKEDSLSCITNNLRELNEIYEISGLDENEFLVDVTIAPAQVEAFIELPLQISLRASDETWEYSSLNIDIQSALYSNYELAKSIFYEHQEEYLFDELVLEQISGAKDYSDPTRSVPTQGVQFSCATPIWRSSEIKSSILQMNEYNFNFLYFNGTRDISNRFLGYDESIKEYYDEVYVKTLSRLDSSVDVSQKEVNVITPKQFSTNARGRVDITSFREFRVNDEETNLIRPEEFRFDGNTPIPCVSVYSKVYDLDYDLLVEIESDEAGKLEVFRLPIRIQIDDSEPKRQARERAPLLDDSQQTRNSQVICEEDNRDNNIEFYTYEISSQGLSPLSQVNVYSECAGITCTDIGDSSRMIQSTNQAIIESSLPFCSNAKITAQREGYYHIDTVEKSKALGYGQQCESAYVNMNEIDFSSNTIPYLDLCLVKLETINFDINSLNLYDIDSSQTITNPQGELYVELSNNDLDYSSFGYYNFQTQEIETELEFPAGEEMEVDVTLMYYEDEELLSYYVFENISITPSLYSNLQATIPVLGEGLEAVEDFEKLENAYDTGVEGVNFGFEFN